MIPTLALQWLPDYCAILLISGTVVSVELNLRRSRVRLLILRPSVRCYMHPSTRVGVYNTATHLRLFCHQLTSPSHQSQRTKTSSQTNHTLHKQSCNSPKSSSSQPPPPSPPLHRSKLAMNTRSLTTMASGTRVGTTASLPSNTSANRQDCWYVIETSSELQNLIQY